jgi:hypothetical protein
MTAETHEAQIMMAGITVNQICYYYRLVFIKKIEWFMLNLDSNFC